MPRITGVDVTPNPHVGEPFFIECTVDGIPSPNIVWVKGEAPLEGEQVTSLILYGYGRHDSTSK